MAERNQDRSYPTARNGHGTDDYEPGHREGDPLSELARLIGHTDSGGAAGHTDASVRAAPREAQPRGYQQGGYQQGGYRQDYPRVQDDPLQDPEGYEPEEEPGEHAAAAGPPQWIQRANLRREASDQHGQAGQDTEVADEDEPAYLDDPDAYRAGYAHDETDEDGRARRPMYLVAGILALAVVGTAGAYGYRSYFGAPRGDPPIIKADTSPTKIPAPSDDAKQPDRMASSDGTEKIVPREEQPVDVDARAAGPRVAVPPPSQNPGEASPSPVEGSLPNGEPRKIRTVAVPVEQPDGGAAPPSPPPAAASKRAKASAGQQANASPNGPLSLAPQAQAGPTATGSIAAGAAGGYLVQVSSQKNEAEAQASFKAMQTKFPAVLGSQKAVIKRADLGEKGTYYRAMVGPFGTSEEASQFCGNLKSAGGQCIVRASTP